MASWQYKFMFPLPSLPLKPAEAIHILCRRGLRFDDTVRLAVKTDEEGHFVDAGEESRLQQPILEDLRRRLENGEQFSVTCRNSEIANSVFFATQSANPHISIAWSRNFFSNLESAAQSEYLTMVRDFAKASRAAYVVLVDDAPDQFEDRFLEIAGVRHLDVEVPHQYGHGIRSIWVDESAGAVIPDGVALVKGKEIGEGFVEYLVP
jgi:hypothetical protein